MKRFFSLLLFSFFFFSSSAYGQVAAPFSLSFEATSTKLEAVYSGPSNQELYLLFLVNRPIGTILPLLMSPRDKVVSLGTSGSGRREITEIEPGITYYALLAHKNGDGSYAQLTANDKTIKFGTRALFYKPELDIAPGGDTIIFSGRITPGHYSAEELGRMKISLYLKVVGTTPPFSEGADPDLNPTKIGPWLAVSQSSGTNPPLGVNTETGEYYFVIKDLTPGETYQYAHKIELDGSWEVKVKTFNSDKGYLSSAEVQDDFERRSYRLLAPFPGLAVLLNPDLCLELIAKGEISPDNKICTKEDPSGFNGFLNYIFKILIGLSAVVLVFRIMFEGYRYIVTDVPFLKVNAKQKLGEAIFGLVLVLCAYLLLNTINPKLVANSISLEKIELGVLEEESDAAPTTEDIITTAPKGVVAACKEGIVKVQTRGGVFYACKTIAEKFKSMVDTAWAQGIKLSGGGFRTKETQIALRAQHCGGASNVFNPRAKCRPPTAYPGRSRHESGLAFDLKCDGKLINFDGRQRRFAVTPGTKVCFDWLKENASKYGLYNLPSENWHWSVDGK